MRARNVMLLSFKIIKVKSIINLLKKDRLEIESENKDYEIPRRITIRASFQYLPVDRINMSLPDPERKEYIIIL